MDVVQNEWQQKEWECFKDPKTSEYRVFILIWQNVKHDAVAVSVLFGWFCSLCLMCKNAKDLGESVPKYCCLGLFFPMCAICMLRGKAREKYGIEVRARFPGLPKTIFTEFLFIFFRETKRKTCCARAASVPASTARRPRKSRPGEMPAKK